MAVFGKQIDLIPREYEVDVVCDADQGMLKMSFFAFNTAVSFSAFGDCLVAENALGKALEECRRFERLFSRTLAHSDVSRLNFAHGEMVEIDFDTFALLDGSVSFCAQSEGVFDITMGGVTRLWDFKNGIVPNGESVREAVRHVDYRGIELYDAKGRYFARLADPLAAVDLGGTAKGYIADRLANLLRECGIGSFLLNLGGNVYASGRKPDGKKWRVGVKNPKNMDAVLGSVELEDCAAVTSGTYDRGFMRDGVRYHHILSPRTGMPVHSDISSVTAAAPSAFAAEGYSTTLLCLGMEKGLDFAASRPEILQAYFIGLDNQIAYARA